MQESNRTQEELNARLIDAVEIGGKDEVLRLLDAGANIEVKDGWNWTALMVATRCDAIEIADLLISRGADIEAENDSGFTPLILASSNGAAETAGLLLSRGANVNAQGKEGWNALMCAAQENDKKTSEILIAHGIDVNAKNKKGETALIIAARNNAKEIADLLLSHGADANAKDNNGNTAASVKKNPSPEELKKRVIACGKPEMDFKNLDEKYVVEYDKKKNCAFVYLWSKKSFRKKPSRRNHISVSAAFKKAKECKWHFDPAGHFIDTYLVAYELNEMLGVCTDDWASLYFVGIQNGKPWEYADSAGNAANPSVKSVNRSRKLANYLLGYIGDDDLEDSDSYFGSKKDLIRTLKRCLENYSSFE